MILQIEDCRDVCRVLFPPHQFDVRFLFDHSQGHDKLRPDGLSVAKMNLQFGGVVPKQRDSDLISPDDFGPHPRNLKDFYSDNAFFYRLKKGEKRSDFVPTDDKVSKAELKLGDTQSMVFTENDVGPFYMTERARAALKHDVVTGRKTVTKNRDELIDEDLNGISGVNGLKSHVSKIAENAGIIISLTKEVMKVRQ